MTPRRPDSAPMRGKGTPGPGIYSPNLSDKRKAPQYGFGTGSKHSKLNRDKVQTPGAGSYNPNANTTLQSNAKWGIGTGTRRPLSAQNKNPGPGTYAPKNDNGGPKYGFGIKHGKASKEKVPGPGTYQPDDKLTKESGPKYGLGSSPRLQKDQSTR